MSKTKQDAARDLQAELVQLNALVRKRRAQLARLEKCPNKRCECRLVWREVIEQGLAKQVGKVRQQIANKAALGSRGRRGRRRSQGRSR